MKTITQNINPESNRLEAPKEKQFFSALFAKNLSALCEKLKSAIIRSNPINQRSIKPAISLAIVLITSLSYAQTATQNYTQTTVPRKEASTETDLNNLAATDKQIITTYTDGLGRPIQQVAHGQSPTSRDIIQISEYDAYGRSSKQYLPFAKVQTAGSYNSTAVSDQGNFYSNTARVAYSQYPFSETVYENSPLNRVTEQSAPGQDWQIGQGHTLQSSYTLNSANEVRLFIESGGNVTSSGYYAASELYKSVSTDEHGNNTIEYADKEGLVVLKKVQLDASTYTQTYYVYNAQNQLVCVIPPQAFADMSSYDVNAEIADRVYRYKYDQRLRVVEKKIPHKGWEYIVYDKLDRPVLTQDAVQRNNGEWLFTKYDALSRPILTGIHTASGVSRTTMQSNVNGATNLYENRSAANYATQHGYSNQAYPTSNIDIHTISYYDNYDFNQNGSPDYTFTTPPSGYSVTSASSRTRGLTTGGKVKVLDGGNTYLTSVSWYDEKRRAIQSRSDNFIGGNDIVHTDYSFVGEVTRTGMIHYDGQKTTVLQQRFNYDHAGRLKQTFHKVNNQDEILYCENFYNELGQLIDKKLHSTNLVEPRFLQSIDYSYNIRGWLTHINNADLDEDKYVAVTTTPGTVLGFDVHNIAWTVNEINTVDDGRYLELLMEDESVI